MYEYDFIDNNRIIKKDNYLIYLMKTTDIKKLKIKLYSKNKVCPILKKEFPIDKMVIDHIHKLKSEDISNEKGVVRDMIEFRANAMLGKIENMWKRYGFYKDEDLNLPDVLRNMADFLENDPKKIEYSLDDSNDKYSLYFAHPNEIPKRKEISKRDINLIKKYWKVLYPKKILKIPKYYNNNIYELLDKIKEIKK